MTISCGSRDEGNFQCYFEDFQILAFHIKKKNKQNKTVYCKAGRGSDYCRYLNIQTIIDVT